jgi:uncharacterized membrane protein
MLAGQLALIAAALFTGAAFFVGFAEQPARLALEPKAFLIQWKRSYQRGSMMQASLVIIGFLLGLFAWWQTRNLGWVIGAGIFLINWPWTLLVVMPVNAALEAVDPADARARPLLERWARLHAVRTMLGLVATAIFLWSSAR